MRTSLTFWLRLWHTLVKRSGVVSVLGLYPLLVNYYGNVYMQTIKPILTVRLSNSSGKEYSFILLSGFISGKWSQNAQWRQCFFQISHDLYWPLVGFALLQTNNAGIYKPIGDSKWLWSWKSMNFIHSRNIYKMKNFWLTYSLRWWPLVALTFVFISSNRMYWL